MTYEEARRRCHVRAAIYRTSHPSKRFWKNHTVPLDMRVPPSWKSADDWEEYDPHEPGPWVKTETREAE